jgi:hypothetical protein
MCWLMQSTFYFYCILSVISIFGFFSSNQPNELNLCMYLHWLWPNNINYYDATHKKIKTKNPSYQQVHRVQSNIYPIQHFNFRVQAKDAAFSWVWVDETKTDPDQLNWNDWKSRRRRTTYGTLIFTYPGDLCMNVSTILSLIAYE